MDKNELRNLFQMLEERNYAAADIEIAHRQQIDQAGQFNQQKERILREGFELKLTLSGADGQELWGGISDIFSSSSFPDQVKSIFVSSDAGLRIIHSYYPRNSFQLFLDFAKPELLDMSLLPSQATLNESNICVEGYNSTWVHGVFSEFNSFVDRHPSQITWIHRHSVYDLLVWVFGLPFGFWVVYKLSGMLREIFGTFSLFVQGASYVYVFLAALVIFRLLFHYARWIWPPIEYRSPRNKALKHRLVLSAITLGIVTTLICDVVKAMF